MKRNALLSAVSFWILIALSLTASGIGAWIIRSHSDTMTRTLLDGTATGVEVYVGQSMIGVGGTILAAGIVGIAIALALGVVARLLRRSEQADADSTLASAPHDHEEESLRTEAGAHVSTAEPVVAAADELTSHESDGIRAR